MSLLPKIWLVGALTPPAASENVASKAVETLKLAF